MASMEAIAVLIAAAVIAGIVAWCVLADNARTSRMQRERQIQLMQQMTEQQRQSEREA